MDSTLYQARQQNRRKKSSEENSGGGGHRSESMKYTRFQAKVKRYMKVNIF